MNISDYLERLGYSELVRADIETLRGLQIAHLQNIPFENLDIGLGRKIELDEPALWDKLITRKRGGFCYELNGMFAWLLKQIGFQVTYLNARDYHEEDDTFGIDFDHLTLLVSMPNGSTRWLADVGFKVCADTGLNHSKTDTRSGSITMMAHVNVITSLTLPRIAFQMNI